MSESQGCKHGRAVLIAHLSCGDLDSGEMPPTLYPLSIPEAGVGKLAMRS